MIRAHARFYAIGIAMLLSVTLAAWLTPKAEAKHASARKVNLEQLVPVAFKDWRIDPTVIPIEPTPDIKRTIEQIYEQTLSRTYLNGQGQRVMLSIAYGGNQSDGLQVHRPEVCYEAQGFRVTQPQPGDLMTQHGPLSVHRLVASHELRIEPITYWIMVGDQRALSNVQRKVAQLRYGLTGQVPDGMIVRVSSIGGDQQAAYRLQESFVDTMLAAMDEPSRVRLVGASIGGALAKPGIAVGQRD